MTRLPGRRHTRIARSGYLIPALLWLGFGTPCLAQSPDATQPADAAAATSAGQHTQAPAEPVKPKRELGLTLFGEEDAFFVRAWLRAQLRFSNPFGLNPSTVETLENPPDSDFEMSRSRLKMEGHLFHPDIGFYFEHSLSGPRPLLDLRLDIRLGDDLRLRAGQYKALYNRERVDSSGRQQFVDRSIANTVFTVDRQRGASLIQRLGKGTRGDSLITAGIYEGDGREPGPRGDDFMYMLRWQWNFLGDPLPFSQSDLEVRERPAATFSLAGATVRGPYTRFSSAGGGQLDGFAAGGDDRYTLEQWQQGFAWHYRGISVQQEYHQKRIEDHETGTHSELRGGYAQAGKLWKVPFGGADRGLEIAGRYAWVDWHDTPSDRKQREFSVVGNLFLDGHNNKLSVDISWLSVQQPGLGSAHESRLRAQWDVSF